MAPKSVSGIRIKTHAAIHELDEQSQVCCSVAVCCSDLLQRVAVSGIRIKTHTAIHELAEQSQVCCSMMQHVAVTRIGLSNMFIGAE